MHLIKGAYFTDILIFFKSNLIFFSPGAYSGGGGGEESKNITYSVVFGTCMNWWVERLGVVQIYRI